MRASRVLVFACIAAIWPLSVASLRSQDAPAPRLATMERAIEALRDRMGTDPFECGRYEKPVTDEVALTASTECVLNAAKQGRRSWTVVYGPDTNGWAAYGAFSGSDGSLRAFVYREPTGGGLATLRFGSFGTCASVKFIIRDQEGRSVDLACYADPVR